MRRNLIYGSICLAALSCFAVLAVAQQRPVAPQQPAATPQPAPAQTAAAPQNNALMSIAFGFMVPSPELSAVQLLAYQDVRQDIRFGVRLASGKGRD